MAESNLESADDIKKRWDIKENLSEAEAQEIIKRLFGHSNDNKFKEYSNWLIQD